MNSFELDQMNQKDKSENQIDRHTSWTKLTDLSHRKGSPDCRLYRASLVHALAETHGVGHQLFDP